MRIAVNTRFLLSARLEGIGWVTHELIRRLVAAHPDDEFLFFFDRPYSKEFIYGSNVRPIVLFPPARHPILWYAWFEFSVARALRRLKPDVFFSPDNYLSLRASTPTVMITHDLAHLHYPEQIPGLVRRYYNHFVPRFLQRADRIVAVSDYTRQDIISQYQIPPEKVELIYNGCREQFVPVPKKEQAEMREKYAGGRPYFFYLGAVHPRKNVDRMIRAFDRFKAATAAPLQLLIGGRLAWQTSDVRAAYEGAESKADIHFLGHVPEADLPRLMGAAFALVYVSLFEGFGLPVLEALRCGVPVISSTTSSLPEVTGEAGLLVDPTSEEAIAEAMQRMYGEPELYRRLVAAAPGQVAKFSWDRAAAQLYEVLKTVAEEHH